MRAFIAGTGVFLPPYVVDNDRLAKLMDTSDEWIRKRTGVVTRRYAETDVASSDLAVPAAEQALSDAGIGRDDIDYVIFSTMSPDFYMPGSGPVFQHKMGLKNVPCLDIRQQCTGFLYGLQLADSMIRSGQYHRILLVTSEVHASFMPFRSWDIVLGHRDARVPDEEYALNTRYRDRIVLFGDAAAAMVITGGEADSRGLIDSLLRADGTFADRMYVNAGGSKFRPYFSPAATANGGHVPIFAGREVYRIAVKLMPEAVTEILERNGYGLADLDLLVMHQANLRISEAVQRRLGIGEDRVFNNIQKYGNTTSVTIPLAFHEAKLAGKTRPGDLVCFVGVGSGLTWGSALYRC